MAGKKTLQKIIALYQIKTGETELDPEKIARFAVENGVELPTPKDPFEILKQEISTAAREELRYDEKTGRPYRAYHKLPVRHGGQTSFVFLDIENATRPQMHRSLNMRREQMVDDGLHLSYDIDRWNSQHPDEDPIQIEMDLTLDIAWRRASKDDDDQAA
ncbi:MAG: hypothetical protein A49_23420 [Methyloceanibacter sp.]|nr:MAG: hypothetical protein A49_23420 [Methyloceanibacter sp.]